MGDMADFALDNAFDDMEHYDRYKDAPMGVQYEEGLIDETGATIGQPWSTPAPYKTRINTLGKSNMKAPKKEGSTEFERPTQGGTALVCTRIIDKGTVFNEKKGKDTHGISIVFESTEVMKEGDYKGQPFLLWANFGNYSMYQNSHMCQFIEGWLGRRFADQDEADDFDPETLLRKPVFANIVHDGQFDNVVSPMPVPNGVSAPVPVGDVYCLDMDNFSQEVFSMMGEKMQAKIAQSHEYKAIGNKPATPEPDGAAPTGGFEDIKEEDIPF